MFWPNRSLCVPVTGSTLHQIRVSCCLTRRITIAGNQFLGVKVAQALSSVVVSGDKIACMGDSVTFGYLMTGAGTATGNTYPGVVATTLNP